MRTLFLILLFSSQAISQALLRPNPDSLSQEEKLIATQYPFIQVQCNKFQYFSTESPNWRILNEKLVQMIELQEGKLNFYHIGGSHLQADIYSHDFRTFLQSNWPGLVGERGLVFPYNLAHPNNPSNYNFSYPNLSLIPILRCRPIERC